MPGFEPAINYNRIDSTIETANKLLFTIPEPLKYLCSLIVFIFFLKAMYPKVIGFFSKFTVQAR